MHTSKSEKKNNNNIGFYEISRKIYVEKYLFLTLKIININNDKVVPQDGLAKLMEKYNMDGRQQHNDVNIMSKFVEKLR